jgi:hypothetical protein
MTLLLLSATCIEAQTVQAVRLEGPSIRMDGRLTEVVWQHPSVVRGLTQREPEEGAPAIDSTEVRFAYDDDALYVGARMFANPKSIRALVTRRDREGSSEQIVVSLDTYRDRRTAYSFSVTPAGVRIDYFHESDSEDDREYGYDPVWQASPRIDSLGWVAEMRIPFTQLRFSPREQQEWGLNVTRLVPARNEESYWQLVRRNETGWSSRMGTLTGIRGIRPSRRVEAIPYVAANSRFQQVNDPTDPFQHERESGARAGGDLKMGLGPNLTLDVTLNPDFGQVEADPAVVNLSAFEIFFDERRPFFTEGADLLDRRGLFYSRRIGAPPPGRSAADFAEARDNVTILGAAKLTGRLASGLSVAALAALTDEERVRTFDATSGQFGRDLVAPRVAYAVAAAQQEFGEDASTLAAMLTMVRRDVHAGTPLADLLVRSAYSGIADGRLRWAEGVYDVSAWAGFTLVQGDTGAILRQQLSSRRYWQRPDASHVSVDPHRRSLSGAFVGIGHSKIAGKHWRWDVDYLHESPGFEPNDMGAFGSVDNRFLGAQLRWRETQPARWYRSYEVGGGSENQWSYHWLRRNREMFLFANAVLPNFWRLNVDHWRSARSYSDRLTRGGPIMGTPRAWGGSMELESRSGARTGWGIDVGADANEIGGWEAGLELSISARPGDRWELSFDPEWVRERDTRQYVTTEAGGRPETFGSRYVFAAVDLAEVSGRFRVNYTFTPNLTLETYAEPFASSGRFHSFGELLRPKERGLLLYGTTGTTIVRNTDGSHTVTDGATSFDIEPEDFNVRSLRSNAVLRWEWRPGSTLYLVWQQDRSADRPIAAARPSDLWDAFRTTGDNVLAIKVSYWIPMW